MIFNGFWWADHQICAKKWLRADSVWWARNSDSMSSDLEGPIQGLCLHLCFTLSLPFEFKHYVIWTLSGTAPCILVQLWAQRGAKITAPQRGKQVLRLPHYDCPTLFSLALCSLTFWSSLQPQCPTWMRPRISLSDRIVLMIPHYAKRLVQAVVRLERLVVAMIIPPSLVSSFEVLYWLVVIDELYGRLLLIGARAPCIYFLFLC